MQASVVRNALRRFVNRVQGLNNHRLHSIQRIDRILDVERSRADRNGSELSLVVFEPIAADRRAGNAKPGLALLRLAGIMLKTIAGHGPHRAIFGRSALRDIAGYVDGRGAEIRRRYSRSVVEDGFEHAAAVSCLWLSHPRPGR